jgi:hypothetical protein
LIAYHRPNLQEKIVVPKLRNLVEICQAGCIKLGLGNTRTSFAAGLALRAVFFIVHLSSLKREADMEDLLFAGINRVEQLDSGCGA